MITTLVVLGIVLLAIPVVCAIFVLFSKLKQRERAEIIKNATSTKTTVSKGANGRTIFETTTIKSSPPQAAPCSPVLPFTQQQASKVPRPVSMKNTWQRLSRPFSAAPAVCEDDEIELTQTQKQRPMPHSSRFKEHMSTALEAPVSPVSPRRGSNSSWNTIDALGSSPISPVSMTGMPHSSSRGFQPSRYGQPWQDREYDYTNPCGADSASNVSDSKNGPKKVKSVVDLSSARGFVATTIKEQVLTDDNKAKAKHAVMGVAQAAGHYAAVNIKKSVLDGEHKTSNVQLTAPSKARVARTRY